jgi:hypothetical protein
VGELRRVREGRAGQQYVSTFMCILDMRMCSLDMQTDMPMTHFQTWEGLIAHA